MNRTDLQEKSFRNLVLNNFNFSKIIRLERDAASQNEVVFRFSMIVYIIYSFFNFTSCFNLQI